MIFRITRTKYLKQQVVLCKFYHNENVTSERAPRVSIRLIHADYFAMKVVLAPKICQYNLCNNNNFIVQTVSETNAQCVAILLHANCRRRLYSPML